MSKTLNKFNYDKNFSIDKRKQEGIFYTPQYICRKMIKNLFKEIDFKNIQNIKILEPSVGSGNFIFELLDFIKSLNQNLSYSNIFKQITCIEKNLNSIEYLKNILLNDYNIEISLIEQNIICDDFFNCKFENQKFDLIIGNPPYGNINNNGKYKNIALSFVDKCQTILKENGFMSFIMPHSFSRSGGEYKKWRENLLNNRFLYSIEDVGNPFEDITLEECVYVFKNNKNDFIKTFSSRDQNNLFKNKVEIANFYSKKDLRMIIYYDDFYKKIMSESNLFPFNGKRGIAISRNNSKLSKEIKKYWILFGKNIQKGFLKHFENYDRYIDDINEQIDSVKENQIVITQFGTNLKACLLKPEDNIIVSDGCVIITYDKNVLSEKEILDYLNSEKVNKFLNRYILNEAKLTVHLDGKYLSQIPYHKDLLD